MTEKMDEFQLFLGITKLLKTYQKTHQYLGEGRHRRCFQLSEDLVIKIPTSIEGVKANLSEVAKYNSNHGDGDIYAWCKIETIEGVPLVIMEYVKPGYGKEKPPMWVDMIDSFQVGLTADGRLVAYDYA